MAPTLRSTTLGTPTSISASSSVKSTRGNENGTPSPSPRKPPTCTKCKRPRAGHPRSGCPFVDSPSSDHRAKTPPAFIANSIVDALGSMQLGSPSPSPFRERDEETRAAIRSRRQSARQVVPSDTLLSLSSSSQDIVEQLLRPGLLDDDDGSETPRVINWQVTPSKSKPTKAKMPGSLFERSLDLSQATVQNSEDKQELQVPTPSTLSSPSAAQRQSPSTLVRTMSLKERDTFLSTLSNSSGATVYVVPANDVHNLQASAIKIGFHARAVVNKDKTDPQALLVLGPDEKAVRRLFEKVEVERKKVPTGRFGALAGGAMVGAVGAWAGLAFA